MTILLANGPIPMPNEVLLDVVFKNVSKEPVRLLKYFDDQGNLPIWFELQMVHQDGSPVTDVQGGGKITLRGRLDYVTLAPGESFKARLDIAKLAPHLTEDTYRVALVYRNQYGQDCFQGELRSDPIVVPVAEKRPERAH